MSNAGNTISARRPVRQSVCRKVEIGLDSHCQLGIVLGHGHSLMPAWFHTPKGSVMALETVFACYHDQSILGRNHLDLLHAGI